MADAARANVDSAEIEKFSQIAAKWWDRNGELKSLHDINPLRLDYINRFQAAPCWMWAAAAAS